MLSGALEDLQPVSVPLCLQIVPSYGKQAPTALPQGPQKQHGPLQTGRVLYHWQMRRHGQPERGGRQNRGLPVAEGRRAPLAQQGICPSPCSRCAQVALLSVGCQEGGCTGGVSASWPSLHCAAFPASNMAISTALSLELKQL